MADKIELGTRTGKIRPYWKGLLLSLITFGIYFPFWYYYLNAEQKAVGGRSGDSELAGSKPGMSVLAAVLGGILIVPPYISVWNFTKRVRRIEELAGIPEGKRINSTAAFLCYFPGGILLIPTLVFFYLTTQHQNRALAAIGSAA